MTATALVHLVRSTSSVFSLCSVRKLTLSTAGFYADVRQSKSRKGQEVVVINHNRSSSSSTKYRSPEPRSSDYPSSGSSRSGHSSSGR